MKKYSHSNTPSSGKSVQWTTFLTLSYPNLALRESALKCLAISGSVGPQNDLKEATALSYLISKAIVGPFEKCSMIGRYSGIIPL